jgi:UDP-glucose 4-epimerase
MPPCPLSPYGVDKLGSELHAAAGWHVHGVPSFGLRFFNVYGPGQNPCSPYSGVISIFSRNVAAGTPVTVHGDGRQVRDFIHVSDVARQVLAAMRRISARSGAIVTNLCTGRGTSLLELLDVLATIHHHRPNIAFAPPRPGDIRRSIGDPSRATALLGRANITLETGLAALAEHRSIAA